jgi:type II secretory pathway pseudopilin PulG
MDLAGQARNARGYAMAALLIAMSITALLMTAAMPVWKQMVQREKEEELVFRGGQYIHAITLYGRKFANTQPPSVDVLVNQKFLRKKYKDPITNDDFQLVLATQSASAAPGRGGGAGSATPGGATGAAPAGAATPGPTAATPPRTSGGISPIGSPGAGPSGGIMGVTSKSKDKSIRLYNGRGHYNEWVFMYQPQQAPGAGGAGTAVTGGRGPNGPTVPSGGTGPFGGSGRGDGRGNRGGDGRGPGGRGPGTPSSGFGTTPFGPRGRI